MGTIAEKLTYLNTTKTMLRDSLNKFGSNILTTDTFRSYDTKLNDIYDKLPKVTATGQGLTIYDVQNGLLDDFKMNGVDLEQNTTETITINEWEQGDINSDGSLASSNSAIRTTNYIKIFPNILYNISRTISTSYMKFRFYDNNKSYLGTQADINITTNKQNNQMISNQDSMELTINDTTVSYMKIVDISNNLNTIYTITTNNTPSPSYPQEIKVVEGRQVITDQGKNLFDKNNSQFATAGTTLTILETGVRATATESKQNRYRGIVLHNTDYLFGKQAILKGTITPSAENIGRIAIYYLTNDNQVYGNEIALRTETGETSFTFPNSLAQDCKGFVMLFYSNRNGTVNIGDYVDYTDVSLRLSSITDNTYEPYYNLLGYNIDLRTQNLSDGVNENYWINTNADGAGKSGTNSGLAIDVSNYNEIIIDTSSLQTRYRVACTNTLPTSVSTVGCYRGVNKDNTSSSITINTTGYNYLIINATDLTKLDVYYKYELAKMPNTNYKNKIYKNNGNWYFEENVKKAVLDGSEDYYEYSINENIIRFQPIILNDLAVPLTQYMSNNFKYLGTIPEATEMGIANGISTTNSRCFIFILKSIASNTANFKTWLSTHNTEVWYALLNPVTTQITNTTLIDQLEAISVHTGTNIITISNSNNIIPEIEITRLKELEKLA